MPPPAGGVSVHLQRLLEKSADQPNLQITVLDLRKRKLYTGNGLSKGLVSAVKYFFDSDVIHIHISHPLRMIMGRIGKLTGKRIIYTLHNRKDTPEPVVQKMKSFSDRIIRVYGDLNDENVIPAYIPPSDVRPLPPELEAIRKKCDRLIVSTGSSFIRLEQDTYGFDVILEALSLIRLPFRTGVVLHDSNDVYRERYSEKIVDLRRKGIEIIYSSGDINFAGLLRKADLFIRSTVTEGDSISVREALQCGTPVVASDCAGRPAGCILFRTGVSEDLAAKIEWVLKEEKGPAREQADYAEKLFALYSEI